MNVVKLYWSTFFVYFTERKTSINTRTRSYEFITFFALCFCKLIIIIHIIYTTSGQNRQKTV